MRDLAAKLGEYLLLVAVTIFACAVMWWVNSKNAPHVSDSALVERPAVVAAPKPLVATQQIPVKLCEVTSKLSGKVRSWEGYSLGFEVPGRVLELGQNAAGEPLDEGDVVTAGQMIARLDDRIYAARKDEAVARYEQAASDFARSAGCSRAAAAPPPNPNISKRSPITPKRKRRRRSPSRIWKTRSSVRQLRAPL